MSDNDLNAFVDQLKGQIAEFNATFDRAIAKNDAGAKLFDLLNLNKALKNPIANTDDKKIEKEKQIAENHAEGFGGGGGFGMVIGGLGGLISLFAGAPEIGLAFVTLFTTGSAAAIYSATIKEKKTPDGKVKGYKFFKTKKQKAKIQHIQNTLQPLANQLVELKEKCQTEIEKTLNNEAYDLVHSPVYDALKISYPNMRDAFLNAAEKALKQKHPSNLMKKDADKSQKIQFPKKENDPS